MAEIRCRSCDLIREVPRLPQPGAAKCPSCGAFLWKRSRPSPTPVTHLGAVARGVFSVTLVFFALLYACFATVPFFFLQLLGAGMLYVVALRFAARAMLVEHGRAVEPPEVTGEELWSFGWFFRAVLHAALFVKLPIAVLVGGLLAGGQYAVPASVVAVALAAYGPMALVIMIRDHSILGLFRFGTGLKLLAKDPLGYLALLGGFVVVYLSDALLDAALSALWLGFLRSALHALGVMMIYGLAGVYIRKHARFLDTPIDDGDWEPIASVDNPPVIGTSDEHAAPPVARREREAIELPGWNDDKP